MAASISTTSCVKAARRFICETYSPERESGEIVGVWKEIFRIAQEKREQQEKAKAAAA